MTNESPEEIYARLQDQALALVQTAKELLAKLPARDTRTDS